MNKFDEIHKLQEEVKAKIEAIGKAGISEFFAPVFAANPNIEQIRWDQYTPYFNDGDACVFRVRAATIKLVGGDQDGGDNGDGFLSDYETVPREYQRDAEREKVAALNITWDFKLPDSAILEQIFGDHAEITVNRDGTVTHEECEHE